MKQTKKQRPKQRRVRPIRRPKPAPRKHSGESAAPGKPFTPNDPRINRTKPGPGRPTNAFLGELKKLEPEALEIHRRAMRLILDLKPAEKDKPAEEPHPLYLREARQAAAAILDRIHGKAKQPLEVSKGFDLSKLTDVEVEQFEALVLKLLAAQEGAASPETDAPAE